MTAIQILVMVIAYVQGFLLGYIIFAPKTPYKQAFLDGLIFKWIWSREHEKRI